MAGQEPIETPIETYSRLKRLVMLMAFEQAGFSEETVELVPIVLKEEHDHDASH